LLKELTSMTASIAKRDLAFEPPRQTYINVRLEEPNLFAPAADRPKPGLFAIIAQRMAAIVAWNRHLDEAAELRAMTDRELADIGLNRGDINRVFTNDFNRDLREARALLG
jgi:uncharacterized protein YjiS (DUF1127 family)